MNTEKNIYCQIVNINDFKTRISSIMGVLYEIRRELYSCIDQNGVIGPMNEYEYEIFCKELHIRPAFNAAIIKKLDSCFAGTG